MSDTRIKDSNILIPELLKQPAMLLWTMIIPQIILLLINARSFWLISNEIKSENIPTVQTIFAIQIGLIILASIVSWLSYSKKTNLPQAWSAAFLFAHIGYLWFFNSHFDKLFSWTIEPWILDPMAVLLYQFTFMMPGLFYSALRLACFESNLSTRKDFGLSLITAISGPALFYLIFISTLSWTRNEIWRFPQVISILLFVTLTVLTFVALMRVTVMAYNGLRSKGEFSQFIFTLCICLAGPLGGLWLNHYLPFPADFQSLGVYVLAITNGLILIVPESRRYDDRRFLLFARAAAFPFTLYFFVVFLPFLPLSLPAMFVAGAGFLILVPVLLFLLHTKRLTDDFKICQKDNGTNVALIFLVAGLLVLPGYFTTIAFKDKTSLTTALKYVYAPDYRTDTTFKGSVASVKRTLISLKNAKQGIQLPYLSAFYNQIVFEGMTLPQSKVEELYKLFSGEDIPKDKSGGSLRIFSRSQNLWRSSTASRRTTDQHVELTATDVKSTFKDGVEHSTVQLTMRNTGESSSAEFARTITIPRGMLITGLRLKIGTEMVPAQIFEKRTAMWVYHMIRDVSRRDPAILTYKSPTQIDLNVFPFFKDQERIVEIDFQYPQSQAAAILIGERSLALSDKAIQDHNPAPVAAERKPYLHFILDYSAGSLTKSYWEQIDAASQKFEKHTPSVVIAANFEINEDRSPSLPQRGSLDLNGVIKKQFLGMVRPMFFSQEYYPQFIVVTNNPQIEFQAKDMEFYCADFPEASHILISAAPDVLSEQPLCNQLKNLGSVDKDDPATFPKDYAQKRDLLLRNFKSIKNPADYERELPRLVTESRNLGVLIPATSLIVVERSAQWKTLQLKEKQRLKTSSGLEFAEDDFQTPAPPLWLMILLMIALLWNIETKQKRISTS